MCDAQGKCLYRFRSCKIISSKLCVCIKCFNIIFDEEITCFNDICTLNIFSVMFILFSKGLEFYSMHYLFLNLQILCWKNYWVWVSCVKWHSGVHRLPTCWHSQKCRYCTWLMYFKVFSTYPSTLRNDFSICFHAYVCMYVFTLQTVAWYWIEKHVCLVYKLISPF